MCVLCSDEEDEDLLEEEEETEEAIDELVDEAGAAENSTSDQPPAVLEGDKEDGSKEKEEQKSERWALTHSPKTETKFASLHSSIVAGSSPECVIPTNQSSTEETVATKVSVSGLSGAEVSL